MTRFETFRLECALADLKAIEGYARKARDLIETQALTESVQSDMNKAHANLTWLLQAVEAGRRNLNRMA